MAQSSLKPIAKFTYRAKARYSKLFCVLLANVYRGIVITVTEESNCSEEMSFSLKVTYDL